MVFFRFLSPLLHTSPPHQQEELSMAVAAGLLVGDGIWTVPASILAMVNVDAPMCMGFGDRA
jgi:hypothetical protein